MKPQHINPLLTAARLSVSFADSALAPTPTENGDPLCHTLLSFSWKAVQNEGLTLSLDLGTTAFIDTVALTLSPKTALTSVVLRGPTGTVLASHRAESGRTVTLQTVELRAGAVTDRLSLDLTADFSDVEIEAIDLYGYLGDAPTVFPTATEEALTGDLLPLTRVRTYSADSTDGRSAGVILADKLLELYSHTVSDADANGDVCFITESTISQDGYRLAVTEGGVTIRASNLRGFVMGAETLLKLVTDGHIRMGTVSDTPFCPFRGVHLFLPSQNALSFTRRLIRHLISPLGYNAVIFEIATGMRYDSHPEITDAALDAIDKGKRGLLPRFPHGSVAEGTVLRKDEIRALVAYIRSYGIEVIPEIQSLGHVPYLTLAHPEIAEVDPDEDKEIDTRAEDARPEKIYPHCYCPSNDRSYEILFDLIDEIVEVFTPREYVHMGHDEVYYMGLCPRCRERSHAELFASDVNRIHDYLQKKGLRMMIWSDMLQPVTKYQTPAAADLIPKDVLCLDFIWYFHLGKDIEENLLSKGFRVGIGNLYSSHFPRYESRIRKSGMIGGQISAWVETTEAALQREGKLYDLYMTAEMLWSDSYTHFCSLAYDRLIAREMPLLRERLKGISYPSRRASAAVDVLFESDTTLPPTKVLGGTEVAFPDKAYASILLTHTMLRRLYRRPWEPCDTVAHYELCYADGTIEHIPVTVGGNIAHYDRRHGEPILHKLYRHNGYTAVYETDGEEHRAKDGAPVTLYRYEHLLKRDTRLVSLRLVEDPAFDAQILLCRVEGYTLPEDN